MIPASQAGLQALRLWPQAAGVAAGVLAVVMYFHFKPEPAPTGIHMPAVTAPEIAKEVKVPVVLKVPLKVYKPAAKKKLHLPEAVQQDIAQHVIASTRTLNDERPHTVTTLVDSDTGEVTTFDRAEPQPWMAVSTKSEVGLFYGIKNGQTAVRLQGQQEFLQVKALRLGAVASADFVNGKVDSFIGVGAWARW